MDQAERVELLKRYAEGVAAVAAATEGITSGELDARETSEEWSPREVIHHLADAELRSTIRLRQLLAEESPTIQGYDEAAYARRLPVDRSIEVSLEAVRAARRANLELLRLVSDAAFARAGTHTESGRYSVEDWLRIYTAHPYDHAEQIRRARSGAAGS